MSPRTRRALRARAVVIPSSIADRIVLVRGHRVMLDRDLAALYHVKTKALNQAVTRNPGRFPADFAFRLTAREVSNLKSQIVTSSVHGGRRKLPRAFTEQGVAMLSGLLNSPRAIAVNVAIMRAFVRLRELVATHRDLARRIDELEQRYDGKFAVVFDAIRRSMLPGANDRLRPQIGFITDGSAAGRQSRSAPSIRRSGTSHMRATAT